MEVELGNAGWELGEDLFDEGEADPAGSAEAIDAVGEIDADGAQFRDRGCAEGLENPGDQRGWAGFADEAHETESMLARDRQREAQDRGVEVKMGVAVPIGRRKPKRAKSLELPANLAGKRLRGRCIECVAQPGARGGTLKVPGGIGDRGDARCAPVAERQVQADAEGRAAPRDADGFVRGGLVHHQARVRERPGGVIALDCFVYRGAAAEIVARDDESSRFRFQVSGFRLKSSRAALCVWRFNLKSEI